MGRTQGLRYLRRIHKSNNGVHRPCLLPDRSVRWKFFLKYCINTLDTYFITFDAILSVTLDGVQTVFADVDTEEGVALPTKETDAIRFQHSAWVHYLNVVPSASRREMSEIENIHVKLYSPDLRTVLAEIEYPKNADLCVCNNNVTIVHPVYPK